MLKWAMSLAIQRWNEDKMPQTRRQRNTAAVTLATKQQRKRKKPDDEASLSSADSLDDSLQDPNSSSNKTKTASVSIKRKSPRKRPSRKRERLLEAATAKEKPQEVAVVVLTTSKAEAAAAAATTTKLTPKKRALHEVEESSSYQIEIAKKAGKKNKEEESIAKRTKVVASSFGGNCNGDDEEEEELQPAALAGNNGTENTLRPSLAPTVNHYALHLEEDYAGEVQEEDADAEEEISSDLPFAVSASADELDSASIDHDDDDDADADADNHRAVQALVTPQQQLPHGSANDSSIQHRHPPVVINNADAAEKDNNNHHHQHLPPHVTAEKANLHQEEDEVSVDDTSDDQDASQGKGDDKDHVMMPRSLLPTLEKDSADCNAPTATSGDDKDAQQQQQQQQQDPAANRSLGSAVSHVEQEPVVRSQGTSLDQRRRRRTLQRQLPSLEVPAEEKLPSRQPSSFHLHCLGDSKKAASSSLHTPLAILEPPRIARVVSPSTAMMMRRRSSHETNDDCYTSDENVLRNDDDDKPATITRRKSRLLLIFLGLFKMIAIAEVIAIGSSLVALVPVPPKSWIQQLADPVPAAGTTMESRSNNKNNNSMLSSVNTMLRDNAQILEKSGTQWLASIAEIRHEAFVAAQQVLQHGKEAWMVVLDNLQHYYCHSYSYYSASTATLFTTRELFSSASRDEYHSSMVRVLIHDTSELLSDCGDAIRRYSYDVVVIMDNGKTRLSELLSDCRDAIREYHYDVLVIMDNNKTRLSELLSDCGDTIREYCFYALAMLDNGKARLLQLVHQSYDYLGAHGGNTVLDTMNHQFGEFIHTIPKEEDPVVSSVPVARNRVEVPPVPPARQSRNQESDDEEMHNTAPATTSPDSEPEQSQDYYPIESSQEEVEPPFEQIPVPSSFTSTEGKKNPMIQPLSNRVLQVIYQEQAIQAAIQETKSAHEMDAKDLVSEEEHGSEWNLAEESEASLEPEIVNAMIRDDAKGMDDTQPMPMDSETIFEESEIHAETIGQTPDKASEIHKPKESSEPNDQAEPKEHAGIHGDANDMGHFDNSPVWFAEATDDSVEDLSDINKAEMDEGSLTDTTIVSSDWDELSEEVARIDLDSGDIGDDEKSPKEREEVEEPLSTVPPKLLSLAAMFNSTVSNENSRISKGWRDAKRFLFHKKSKQQQEKREKRGPRKMSLLLSKVKTIFGKQTSNLFRSKKKGKEEPIRLRLPKRVSSFWTKFKSSIETRFAATATRLTKWLSVPSRKAPKMLSTMTPIQLREPVGAPILHKYKVAHKIKLEQAAKLQKARREDDSSKHPGTLANELLQKSRRVLAQWFAMIGPSFQQRFLVTKALLRQDSIEESML